MNRFVTFLCCLLGTVYILAPVDIACAPTSEDEDFLAFIRSLEAELGPNAEKLVESNGADSSREIPPHLTGSVDSSETENMRTNFLASYQPLDEDDQPEEVKLPYRYEKAADHYLETLTKKLQKLESFLAALPRQTQRFFSTMIWQASQDQVSYRKTIDDIISNLQKISDTDIYKVSLYDPGFSVLRDLMVRYVEKIKPLLELIVLPEKPSLKLSLSTEQTLEDLARLVAYDFAQLDIELKNVLAHSSKSIEEIRSWREDRQQKIKNMFARKNFGRWHQQGLSRYRNRSRGSSQAPYYGPTRRPRGYGSGYGRGYGHGGYAPYHQQHYRRPHHFGQRHPHREPAGPQKESDSKKSPSSETQRDQSTTKTSKRLERLARKVDLFKKVVSQAQATSGAPREDFLAQAAKIKADIEEDSHNFDTTQNRYKKINAIYKQALASYAKMTKKTDSPIEDGKKNNISQAIKKGTDPSQLTTDQNSLEAERIALEKEAIDLAEQARNASEKDKKNIAQKQALVTEKIKENAQKRQANNQALSRTDQEQYDLEKERIDRESGRLYDEQKEKTRQMQSMQEQLHNQYMHIAMQKKEAQASNDMQALEHIEAQEQELLAMERNLREQFTHEKIIMQQEQESLEKLKKESMLRAINLQSVIAQTNASMIPHHEQEDPRIIEVIDDQEDQLPLLEQIIQEDHSALGHKDRLGNTPLHYVAAHPEKINVQQVLLAHGAPLNAENDAEQTPHTIAAIAQNAKALSDLLELEDRVVNFQDQSGNTALHYALMNRDLESIRVLAQHGASLHIPNNAGVTPLEIVNQYRPAANRNYNQAQYLIQSDIEDLSNSQAQHEFALQHMPHTGTYIMSGTPDSPHIMALTDQVVQSLEGQSFPMIEQAAKQEFQGLSIVGRSDNEHAALWFKPPSNESFLPNISKMGRRALHDLIAQGAPISTIRTESGALVGIESSDILFEPLLLAQKEVVQGALRALDRSWVMIDTIQQLAHNNPIFVRRAQRKEALIDANMARYSLEAIERGLELDILGRSANSFITLTIHQDILRCMIAIGALDVENKQFSSSPVQGWWAHQEQYIRQVTHHASRGALYYLGLDNSREAMLCWKSHELFNLLTTVIIHTQEEASSAKTPEEILIESAIKMQGILSGLDTTERNALIAENRRYVESAKRALLEALPSEVTSQPGLFSRLSSYLGLNSGEKGILEESYQVLDMALSNEDNQVGTINLHKRPGIHKHEDSIEEIDAIISPKGYILDISNSPLNTILLRAPAPPSEDTQRVSAISTIQQTKISPVKIGLQSIRGSAILGFTVQFIAALRQNKYTPLPKVPEQSATLEVEGTIPRTIEQSHAIINARNDIDHLNNNTITPMVELYEKARNGDEQAQEQLRTLYSSNQLADIKLRIDQTIKYNHQVSDGQTPMFGFFASGITAGIAQYFAQEKSKAAPFVPIRGMQFARFANGLMFPMLGSYAKQEFLPKEDHLFGQEDTMLVKPLSLEECVERQVNKQLQAGSYMLGLDVAGSQQAAVEVALQDFEFAITACNKELEDIIAHKQSLGIQTIIPLTYEKMYRYYNQFTQGFKVFKQKDILAWLKEHRELFTELLKNIDTIQRHLNTQIQKERNEGWFSSTLSYVTEKLSSERRLLPPEEYQKLNLASKQTYLNDIISYKLMPLLQKPDRLEQERIAKIRVLEQQRLMAQYQKNKLETDKRWRPTIHKQKPYRPQPPQRKAPVTFKPVNPYYQAGKQLLEKASGNPKVRDFGNRFTKGYQEFSDPDF